MTGSGASRAARLPAFLRAVQTRLPRSPERPPDRKGPDRQWQLKVRVAHHDDALKAVPCRALDRASERTPA